MICCAKCGTRVGVVGRCLTCKRRRKISSAYTRAEAASAVLGAAEKWYDGDDSWNAANLRAAVERYRIAKVAPGATP